ncbi:hypothetical protein DFH08DRAFT_820190 [Mycena albidolilacea]|uniref:Uncharacterized protein n=1 Tax=Mycena albidolilacea TaxID=1033008 RepID=A0AAD7EFK9_9AGAR|nr:hypothetical protein DFH08DRAFT_820190 [Mycena albidolilacea]
MQLFAFSIILIVLVLGAQGANIPAPITYCRCASDSSGVSCAAIAAVLQTVKMFLAQTQVSQKQLMAGLQAIAAVLQTVKMFLAQTQVSQKQLMAGLQAIAAVLQPVKMFLARVPKPELIK